MLASQHLSVTFSEIIIGLLNCIFNLKSIEFPHLQLQYPWPYIISWFQMGRSGILMAHSHRFLRLKAQHHKVLTLVFFSKMDLLLQSLMPYQILFV